MRPDSPALTATLRALRGIADLQVVASALCDREYARILALAPNVHPVISALGALAGGLPDVIPSAGRDSPALHAAIASLIGTDAGARILPWWAEIAPAGWGASHAAALIDAAQRDHCPRWAAAALIGPCDASAALPSHAYDIAHTVRRWGQATPDLPTAWMDALAPAERDRLLDALRTAPYNAAECLPWLPEDYVTMVAVHIDTPFLTYAFDSYAEASSVAHAHHAAILSELIQRAGRDHLATLTRLAVASRMDAAWDAVVRLLGTHPWYAANVVAAASWDDLRTDVQDIFFPSAANHNDVCAAIAFARGMHDQPPPITRETACAFFGAITPTVWDTLPTEIQRAWYDTLRTLDTHLAVRSLGLDPAFLARAELNDSLVTAVRRHLHDDAAVQRTLLPIAVRSLLPAEISDVVAALPMPIDPVAFVQIASGAREMPLALRDWITAHPTPHACRTATTALHAALRSIATPVAARCAALAAAFAGWSSEDATALLAALPDDVRTALHPGANALADALAHPDRRNTFRQALGALAALPPSAALPALLALGALAAAYHVSAQQDAGKGVAQALRSSGSCFLALVDTLTDASRTAILPLPRSASHAAAVRAIAAADPLVAHHLAHALRFRNPTAALDALTEAPFDALTRIWRLLPKALQQFVLGDRDALLHNVAAPGCGDDLAQALQAWGADDPLPLLALRMLIGDSEERRAWGISALAQRPDVAAALLPLMHADARMLLERDSRIAIAGSDLPPPRSPMPAPVRRRRR
jgi:hypothetical protein